MSGVRSCVGRFWVMSGEGIGCCFFFFQAEDGIRDRFTWLEFRRVLFRSVKLVTHTGFFLYVSLKWRYTACKTMCLGAIVEFSAACPLRLHGSSVKMTLFHAQSINSPIAPCVNFDLLIPPEYHDTLGRQKNANLLLILYRLWWKKWWKLR